MWYTENATSVFDNNESRISTNVKIHRKTFFQFVAHDIDRKNAKIVACTERLGIFEEVVFVCKMYVRLKEIKE